MERRSDVDDRAWGRGKRGRKLRMKGLDFVITLERRDLCPFTPATEGIERARTQNKPRIGYPG